LFFSHTNLNLCELNPKFQRGQKTQYLQAKNGFLPTINHKHKFTRIIRKFELQEINDALKKLFCDVCLFLFLAHLNSQKTVIHAVVKDSED